MSGQDPIRMAYILTPIEFGGSERVGVNFLNHVNRTSFNLMVIALLRPWEPCNIFLSQIRDNGFEVAKVPVALFPREEGRDILRVPRCFLHVYQIIRHKRIELIHTHGYFADTVGIPAAWLRGIPSISTCHGFIENDRKLHLYNRLDRLVLRLADRVIAVSHGIRDELLESRLNPKRVCTIPNAVPGSPRSEIIQLRRMKNRKLLGLDERQFVLGYVGRLSREKGLNYLIMALGKLRDLPVKAILIGEGEDKICLEAQARREGLSEKVVFAGFQACVEDWFPALDLFVLPSLVEGTPMSLLEAMAYGVPVIATSVGGVPGVIKHGVHGFLVPPADPESLAATIFSLWRDSEERDRFASRAKAHVVSRYGIKGWVERMEAEYKDVLLGQQAQVGGR